MPCIYCNYVKEGSKSGGGRIMAEDVKKNSQDESVLTKKDLDKCFWRLSLFGEMSLNFERMQSLGWCNAMIPALKKLYTKKEDFCEALQRHLQFFNTELTFGNLVFGPTIALEEEKSKNPDKVPDELITSFKTGLMGPVAAIGDSINWGTAYTLCLAFAASLATKGSPAAVAVMIAYCIAAQLTSYLLFHLGYKTGRTSFTKIMKSGLLNEVLTGANILGMFMVGALSSNLVTADPTLKIGKFVLKDFLDGIVPGLLPLAIVFAVYFLIRKKQVSTAKIVLLIIAIGIAGSVAGIF